MRRFVGWAGLVVAIWALAVSFGWQNEVQELLGIAGQSGGSLFGIVALELLVAIGLLAASRGVRRLFRWIRRLLERYVPRWASTLVGSAITATLLVMILNGFLFTSFIRWANQHYGSFNQSTPAGAVQPTSSYRSGATDSVIPWQTLGFRGKEFISRGPSVAQLTAFRGNEAKQPIRIYAGLLSANTPSARAELAVAELKRTNAAERTVWVVATATGSGWIEPEAVDSLEYMHGGDTAVITQQYSYLPSWISFLVDQNNATNTGRELFDAVYAYWSQLPVDSRPKLYAYGLSLGSFGAQTAFTTPQDITRRTDGALFVGTPSTTALWQRLNEERDNVSPLWQPSIKARPQFRWASTPADIQRDTTTWPVGNRVLYLQHASDPVVWWNPDLIFHKPAWLSEPRGHDVSPRTRWFPFVTFFQVSIDQFFGVSVPIGHGHNYANTMVSAWQSLTTPQDWSNDKAEQLEKILTSN